ncbi:SDR family NAD(P)-dependent oxidoreductase [Intestinibacillus sp. Marseille-P6563]|uniref:SDR family NAD(P)-dependent oxidoreductase n=1 Tax=Intestinibacillus sp. Marseille-P6563 TaxID=2364792 RepID=UPI000F04B78A|nr:SDR family oxidoreductase [Intestinibacillus sp. Marseille-P6563]
MDLKLNGKLALVTGSSAGIGKGIAKCLLQEGATVFINGRNADALAKTAEELSAFGPCHMAVGDLGTAEGAQAVIDAVDQFGELDILVGNMGTYKGTPFAEISDEEWEWMMNINLLSQVRMCRHFLPKMLERNRGRIVLIASECGIKPLTDMVHYSVSKTAVIGLARALAETTKGTKVAVNSLLPGLTWTENTAAYQTDRARREGKDLDQAIKEYFVTYEPTQLLQRITTVEEIASTVVYYCSEVSAATNGATIRAEGGLIRSI